MKELGIYLKKTRISNGVSLEEAAKDIDISVVELENIEKGNTRAFKDIYKMKEYVRIYAKYLGLDSDKVTDDFNEFIFEHTSKLSLEDIENARDTEDENTDNNKIKSPYTIEHKLQINYRPIIIVISAIILILIIITLVILGKASSTSPRTSELKSNEIRGGDLV